MKKLAGLIIVVIIIAGSFWYKQYIRNVKINECLISQDEEMIGACAIANRFKEISNYFESVQTAYNFNYNYNYNYNYNHNSFKFTNKKYQENFMRVYADNIYDCKTVVGCKLKDEGKGYYVALNNCLLNGYCMEGIRNLDECIESYERYMKETPEKFKYEITATKEQACQKF